ncbi:MAG: T9SS type A sorting domain-containing protein [Chitinophagales bacterium]|nr:T9SS type A sorting domain-containing protein [Chitinophagales bacterium]
MARFILICVVGFLGLCKSNGLYSQSIPYPDRHSTNLSDGWLSCEPSANPNQDRGISHWIMYDLGQNYEIKNFFIWNFNTPERINSYNNEAWSRRALLGKLEDGMHEIVIDVSDDGKTWEELTHYFVPKASGSSIYTGEIVPDYFYVAARYVLITGLSNHGGNCYGLGEIKIEAEPIITQTDDIYAATRLSVYPNPAREKTKLYLKDFSAGEAVIQIVDILGQQVDWKPITITGGTDILEIQVGNYPSGLYFLNVIQQHRTNSTKLEVIK